MTSYEAGWFKPFATIVIILLFIFVGLPLLSLFYLFVASPVQISGSAIAPNYIEGQYWIVNKLSTRVANPKRGEVIVFISPRQQDVQLVKRIVALPGDKVAIQNGEFYVNNQVLAKSNQTSAGQTNGAAFLKEGEPQIVPQNVYFVLGDNRVNSTDSREWGFVKRESIIGNLWFRYR